MYFDQAGWVASIDVTADTLPSDVVKKLDPVERAIRDIAAGNSYLADSTESERSGGSTCTESPILITPDSNTRAVMPPCPRVA
jgi:hypothetical protein